MSNIRQPKDGSAVSGPITMLGADGSYIKLFDSQGVSREPQAPLVQYSKGPASTAGTPSTAQVLALCQSLAELVPEALLKSSAYLSRIALMPQQAPATGYSSLAATYNYTFGSTAVAIAPTTRYAYSESVPVDLVNANPTLTSDLAFRMGAQLAAEIDAIISAQAFTFLTTNAATGTTATVLTDAVIATSIALLPNTGEPIFLVAYPTQCGLSYLALLTNNGTGLVPFAWNNATGLTTTLANAASPTPSLQGCWIVPSAQVKITGGAPGTGTIHNVMFTPSAIAAVFEVETNINNTNTTPIANAIATGSFGNVTVTVWALNTGSGVQTIYCTCVFGQAVGINANGVTVKS